MQNRTTERPGDLSTRKETNGSTKALVTNGNASKDASGIVTLIVLEVVTIKGDRRVAGTELVDDPSTNTL